MAEVDRLRSENARLRDRLQLHELDAQLKHSAHPSEHFAGGLSTIMEVAKLNEHGALPMASNTTHVLMEIGCSDRDTVDKSEELLNHPNAFLVSFEPLLDKVSGTRGGTSQNVFS